MNNSEHISNDSRNSYGTGEATADRFNLRSQERRNIYGTGEVTEDR